MKEHPNWAEIVSALATSMTTIVGLPAVYLLLRDRAERQRARLRVSHFGGSANGAVVEFKVSFSTTDRSEALFVEIQLLSPGALATADQYKPQVGGVLDYGGVNFVEPNVSARKIRIPLRQYTQSAADELSAYFGAIGASISSGVNLKVAVVTSPRRRMLIHRKAMISSTN